MKKLTLLLSLLLVSFTQVNAQWTDMQSPLFGSSVMWSVQVIDANTVWALNLSGAMAIKTTNGGLTWTAHPVNDPNFAGFFPESVAALDATTAWLTATNSANPPATKFYKTTDGGLSWQIQKTLNSYWGFANHFFDSSNGVTIGSRFVPSGQYFEEKPEILITADGGLNWVVTSTANLPQFAQSILYRSFSVVNNTIWYISYDGKIYKSTDKGQTWAETDAGFASSLGVITGAIAFTDMNNGLAAKDGVLKRTTDGGTTWTTLNPTGTFNSFEISAVPGAPGTYVSAGRYLNDKGSFISIDNGDNWVTMENTRQHFDLKFINATTGWSGGVGKMFKFNPTTTGSSEYMESGGFLIFPNPSKGIYHISADATKPLKLEIYDLTGRKILQKAGSVFGNTTIDLSGQKKGIYMLHLVTAENRVIEKIVLQ